MKKETKIYDFIVVGGGLGGLISAAILSKNKFSVLVLEKNKQLGGSLQVFTRDKTIFDTGVHYVGSLAEGQNLNMLYKYLGIMDKLNVEQMDSVFEKIHFNDENKFYEFHQGYGNYVDGLVKDFPHEKDGIEAYVKEIQNICDFFPFYRLTYQESNYFMNEDLNRNAKDHIASFIKDEKLRNVLAGTSLLYGGVAEKTPFYVHALVLNSYIESSFRCINGGSQIAIQLSKVIHQNGGEILKKQIVESSKYNENGEIEYVVTTEGKKFFAKTFISNVHPKPSLKIFGEKNFKKVYVKRVNSLENSISCFSLHLVLKENTVPYQNFNIYHHNSESTWGHEKYTEENWPLSYLVSMSPNQSNQKWADGISVLSYMRYDEVEKWADTFNTVDFESERSSEYHDFKEKKARIMIEDLEKVLPGISNKITSYYTSTPLSFRDYIGTDDGSMYGILKDFSNPLRTLINSKTKVKNLFLTGQNLNLHGVLGVSISAFVTCFNFIDHNELIRQIHEK